LVKGLMITRLQSNGRPFFSCDYYPHRQSDI